MNKIISRRLKTTTALTSILMASIAVDNSLANPEGGKVVAGDVTITEPNPTTVQVDQFSQKAIVDWRSFNIAPNETTRFVQPNSQAWILNRINGSHNPTTIQGTLEANGNVAIVNPDGIVFSQGARIDVNSLIATTHNISNDDFMAGQMNFNIPGNPAASVINEGSISIGDHGLGAFVAPGVRNSGVITARLGNVSLAAGNKFTLDLYGDGLVNLAIDDQITHEVIDLKTGKLMSDLVKNSGTIKADGGTVALKAATARRAVNAVINNTGVIEANTIGLENGKIILGAQTAATKPQNAPQQKVKVSGRLQTTALPTRVPIPKPSPRTGGDIEITGEAIELANATIDASGVNGGGAILIGGDYLGGNGDAAIIDQYNIPLAKQKVPTAKFLTANAGSLIKADALENGNGGKIILWSDEATQVASEISSRGGVISGGGGFVETSGANLNFSGLVDVSSGVNTDHGTWLMDPIAVVIRHPDQRLKDSRYAFGLGSDIYTPSIENTLNRGGTVHITARTPYIAGRSGIDGQERAEIDVSEIDVKYNYISLDAPITVTGTEPSKLIFDTSGAIFNDFTSYQQAYNRAETIYSLNAPMDVEFISDTGQIRFGCPPTQGSCAGLSASPDIFTNGGILTLTESSNITFIDDGRTITVPKPSDLMPRIYLSATSDRSAFDAGLGSQVDRYGTFFKTPTPIPIVTPEPTPTVIASQKEEIQEEVTLVENPENRVKIPVRPIRKNALNLDIDDIVENSTANDRLLVYGSLENKTEVKVDAIIEGVDITNEALDLLTGNDLSSLYGSVTGRPSVDKLVDALTSREGKEATDQLLDVLFDKNSNLKTDAALKVKDILEHAFDVEITSDVGNAFELLEVALKTRTKDVLIGKVNGIQMAILSKSFERLAEIERAKLPRQIEKILDDAVDPSGYTILCVDGCDLAKGVTTALGTSLSGGNNYARSVVNGLGPIKAAISAISGGSVTGLGKELMFGTTHDDEILVQDLIVTRLVETRNFDILKKFSENEVFSLEPKFFGLSVREVKVPFKERYPEVYDFLQNS